MLSTGHICQGSTVYKDTRQGEWSSKGLESGAWLSFTWSGVSQTQRLGKHFRGVFSLGWGLWVACGGCRRQIVCSPVPASPFSPCHSPWWPESSQRVDWVPHKGLLLPVSQVSSSLCWKWVERFLVYEFYPIPLPLLFICLSVCLFEKWLPLSAPRPCKDKPWTKYGDLSHSLSHLVVVLEMPSLLLSLKDRLALHSPSSISLHSLFVFSNLLLLHAWFWTFFFPFDFSPTLPIHSFILLNYF